MSTLISLLMHTQVERIAPLLASMEDRVSCSLVSTKSETSEQRERTSGFADDGE